MFWLVIFFLVHELIFSLYNLKMNFVIVKWERKKSISCKLLASGGGGGFKGLYRLIHGENTTRHPTCERVCSVTSGSLPPHGL